MREHEVNKLDNFIMGWYLDNNEICDTIIEFYKNNPNKKLGTVYDNSDRLFDQNRKLSIDCALNENDSLMSLYVKDVLTQVMPLYIKKYNYCQEYGKFLNKEGTNVQYYPPNGGFFVWHCERSTGKFPSTTRHLVYMTYLNDVDDGGETEFYYQNVKIKPEKGLTLIWPADWTFTHRGLPSPTEEKYIVTGWFNYD